MPEEPPIAELIAHAVEEAIQPLQNRIFTLETTIARQGEMLAALESTQEQDVTRICLDIAYDRQRISKLEKVEPQPLQKDRGEILRALLVANGGKMLAKDARKRMRVPKSSFSELVKICDFIDIKPYHLDSRQDVLVLNGS